MCIWQDLSTVVNCKQNFGEITTFISIKLRYHAGCMTIECFILWNSLLLPLTVRLDVYTVNGDKQMWLIYAILILRSTDNAITVILLVYMAVLLYQVIDNMPLLLY